MHIEDMVMISSDGARQMPDGVFDAKHLIDAKPVNSTIGERFERLAPANGALVSRRTLGREKGRFGIEEYLELKTVQLRIGNTRANWI